MQRLWTYAAIAVFSFAMLVMNSTLHAISLGRRLLALHHAQDVTKGESHQASERVAKRWRSSSRILPRPTPGQLAHFSWQPLSLDYDDTRRAKEQLLRAGELGYSEGFSRAAEICIQNRNWDEAKRLYKMAAAKFHVVAIFVLAVVALFELYEK
jgi:hypothetical protein